MSTVIDVERAVNERYGRAARSREPQLCCPIDYDPNLLAVIPDEIKERDYGCGVPSRFVYEGDDYEVTQFSGTDCCEPGSACC